MVRLAKPGPHKVARLRKPQKGSLGGPLGQEANFSFRPSASGAQNMSGPTQMSPLPLESKEKWLEGVREQGMSRELWVAECGMGWQGREDEGPWSQAGDLGVYAGSTGVRVTDKMILGWGVGGKSDEDGSRRGGRSVQLSRKRQIG